jgi:DMSO/TMAO reductase YedYZ molybdopterin-dependent catalytic subunit
MPVFDRATWRLKIGGLVEQPLSLSYDELRALPRVDQVSTFHCVTGWTVDKVHWGGVRLNDVLDRARPQAAGHALRFVSMEVPYVDYLTRRQASLHDVMLAYEMDGKPLPQEHGAPVRLIIPEMYGYKNVKWLHGIEVVRRAGSGYWENLGYDRDAWVGRSNGYGA